MKSITTHYEITRLVEVEITRYPRTRLKKIELIIGGEGHIIQAGELLGVFKVLEEIKNDLKL